MNLTTIIKISIVGPMNSAGSSGVGAMVSSARKLEEEEDTFIRKFLFNNYFFFYYMLDTQHTTYIFR